MDHAMRVVISETTEIWDDMLMNMGVVLHGTTLEKKKSYPAIINNEVIGTGANALGPITVRDSAKIGGGAVVIKSACPRVDHPGRTLELGVLR